MSELPWREGHPVHEAATPVFELTSNDKGELIVDMGSEGEVIFHPEQQGIVLQIASQRHQEGLRGEALRQAIIQDLEVDMATRRHQAETDNEHVTAQG